MIAEWLLSLISIVALIVSFAKSPSSAYCGNGWYADRVSRHGFYACKRTVGYDREIDDRPVGWRVGWISCAPPQRAAIGYDGVTVSCH